jgi:hypothetical protein
MKLYRVVTYTSELMVVIVRVTQMTRPRQDSQDMAIVKAGIPAFGSDVFCPLSICDSVDSVHIFHGFINFSNSSSVLVKNSVTGLCY